MRFSRLEIRWSTSRMSIQVKSIKILVFCAFVVACTSIDAFGDRFPIAENLPPKDFRASFSAGAGLASDNDRVYDNRIGQSFSPTQTGRLVEVSWIVDVSPCSEFAPLKIALHTIKDGLPGRMISAAYIDQSILPDGEETRPRLQPKDFTATAVFSDRPLLLGWRNYCFILTSDEPNANYRITGTQENGGGYAFGTAYEFTRNKEFNAKPESDYFFRAVATTVNPLPYLVGLSVFLLVVGFCVGYCVFRCQQGSRKRWRPPAEMGP